MVQVLELEPGATVVDLCCGQGRHAVLLAEMGYRLRGLDLSLHLLKHARDSAEAAGVDVTFIHGDMREISWEDEFDTVRLYTATELAWRLPGAGSEPLTSSVVLTARRSQKIAGA